MGTGRARRQLRPLGRGASLLIGGTLAVAVVTPVMAQGGPVLAARKAAASGLTTVVVERSQSWGQILALSGNWTVYRLTSDRKDDTTCTGGCTKVWPPVLLAHGQAKPMGVGLGHLGALKRPDGSSQVTYEGVPLYRFVGDIRAGQVTGNGKDKFGQWWVVDPSNPTSVPKSTIGGAPTTTAPGGGISY